MRLIVPTFALLISVLSVFSGFFPPSLASPLCAHSLCRPDQLLAAVDAAGATPQALSLLIYADPANPYVWCTYAEVLSVRGDTRQAEAALDRAVALGPSMPPVLMRAANYDFTHGRREQGIALASRILSRTNVFDEIVFSYLLDPSVPTKPLLGTAIPAAPRPAKSWLSWLNAHGSEQDIADAWAWMKTGGLLDGNSAAETAWALWNRGFYRTAWVLWKGDSPAPQLLANNGFAAEPVATPFDWALNGIPAAAIVRQDGLEVRFTGAENLAFYHVHQFTVANPGRYRFSAEVSSDNVSTDQRPFFRIYDPADPGRLSVVTAMVDGSAPKSRVAVDFTVIGRPEPLLVELDRVPSQRFDNRISGTFHVYEVSLVPLP